MTRLSVLCAGPYGQSCPGCWFCVLDLMDRDDQIVCFVCRTVWTKLSRLLVLCAGPYGQR